MTDDLIRSTWAVPILLALTSSAALVIALTGDGWRDAASWIGLGLPVLAVAWARRRAMPPRARRARFGVAARA